MFSVDIYDQLGAKVGTHDLDTKIFDESYIDTDLIHQAFVRQMANQRVAIAHVKTRGDIHGSGKKLYRQKGTGSARVGSKKSPIRRGGGVVFGPSNERNFSQKMNKKMSRRAMRGLLTLKAQDKQILALDSFSSGEIKTKRAVVFLQAAGLADKKVLLVIPSKNEGLQKIFRNIPKVRYVHASYLNPRDVMYADAVVVIKDSFPVISQVFA